MLMVMMAELVSWSFLSLYIIFRPEREERRKRKLRRECGARA